MGLEIIGLTIYAVNMSNIFKTKKGLCGQN